MLNKFIFPLFIASRYLWARKGEAFITIISIISVLGVAIGVMVLNVVMAVMTGFENELRERIIGADSHIIVRQYNQRIAEWQKVAEAIKGVRDVVAVSPFSDHQALIKYEDRSSGVLIRGVAPDSAAEEQLASYLTKPESSKLLFRELRAVRGANIKLNNEGEVSSEENAPRPTIIVGREMARNLGILPGVMVSLFSPNVASTPFGLLPTYQRYVVAAAYGSGLIEYENTVAYVSLKEAQRFFRTDDTVTGFEVRVKDPDASPQIAKTISDLLARKSEEFGGNYIAQDWGERNRALWQMFKLEKRVYFIVLLLIIMMASISIVTTLVMVVLEKRRDIAVLRTMGAKGRVISTIFVIQGATIGLVGTVLGLLLGYIAAIALAKWGFPIDERVFGTSTVPVRIEGVNFLIVACVSFLITCLATIYPAKRASALPPTDALRYE